ncbi:MAG: hypothetical protein QNL62_06840 [Gammaproteobacteria bacterium]|nr:hypothetical protein [Gammaproteobacteria bacterium]
MIINRIIIKTNTVRGIYGSDIKLTEGLNIVRAENTSGKSTCMQAILYTLGLEGALGPSRKLPLKSAVTTELIDEDGETLRIINTVMYLEIEHNGKRITIKRSADLDNNNLINVWDDFIFSGSDVSPDSKDYYVRLPGAATNELGFHNFLANFLDLNLPMVLKYDGGKSPLYLEALFSLFYVEQSRGWGSIQNTLPTYLGIKDVGAKSIEFVLDLDSFEIHGKRQEINDKLRDIEKKWEVLFSGLSDLSTEAGGLLSNTPERPVANQDSFDLSSIILVDGDNKQKTISEEISVLRHQLMQLQEKEIPTINQAADQIQKELDTRQDELSNLEILQTKAYEDNSNAASYISSIQERIRSLTEDRRKYKDVKRLISLGSKNNLVTQEDICPTCHQGLSGSLIEGENIDDIYDIDENIQHIESQIEMLKSVLKGEKTRQEQCSSNLYKLNNKVSNTRKYIRSLKSSLMSDGRLPSRAAIRQELEIENEIEKLEYISEEFSLKIVALDSLRVKYELAQSAKQALPKSHLSAGDHKKLADLKSTFINYLSRFDYKSEKLDKFEISDQTYKPTIDGVELGFNSSASDNIRMIWAYLYSLLAISQSGQFCTNHIGLLVLDEPRQQEAKELSFKEFIDVTSQSRSHHQQVIMATSEDYEKLKAYCENVSVNLIHYNADEKLIAKLPSNLPFID